MKPHNIELMSIIIPFSNIKMGDFLLLLDRITATSALSGFTSVFGIGRGKSTAEITALINL